MRGRGRPVVARGSIDFRTGPGKGMSEELFIDSHVHVLPEKRLQGLMRWIKRAYPGHPVPERVSGADIVRDLGRCGATHFFNLVYPLREEETGPLNEFNAQFCAETPGAIPFASLHPDTRDKAAVAERALASHPFVGFKFHPFVQGFDPWDRRMDPLYELLQEVGRPVLFHTGFEDFYQRRMPITELAALLGRYPKLPMVFVHMAFPELPAVFRLLDGHPDLYLDATNVVAFFRPEFEPMLAHSLGGLAVLDQVMIGFDRYRGRILVGSDHPAGMGGLEDIYRDLHSLRLDETAKRELTAGAARAFVSRFLPGFDWSRRLDPGGREPEPPARSAPTG